MRYDHTLSAGIPSRHRYKCQVGELIVTMRYDHTLGVRVPSRHRYQGQVGELIVTYEI